MAADWETEEIKIPIRIADKWEGEDEDDDIRDNWDDDEEEENNANKEKESEAEIKATQARKKKGLKERLAEKEEQKRKELEEAALRRKAEMEEKKTLTPKQIYEEKMRRQKIQEEADLSLAIEAFVGLTPPPIAQISGNIDKSDPTSSEDFDHLAQLLAAKISKYKKVPTYSAFLEALLRDLILVLESEDLKKLSNGLNATYNEKLKLQKTSKTKKKGRKSEVGEDMVKNDVYSELADYI